jgi:hypothetical protein
LALPIAAAQNAEEEAYLLTRDYLICGDNATRAYRLSIIIFKTISTKDFKLN